MAYRITVLPHNRIITAPEGANLLNELRNAALAPDAPCGGEGRCGKCRVLIDSAEVLACKTSIHRDMTVTLPAKSTVGILTDGAPLRDFPLPDREGFALAFDIGTTTVAGYLLEGKTGRELAVGSLPNPQTPYGADVISRIRHAIAGQAEPLTACIRCCLEELTRSLCRDAEISPGEITVLSVVGNPAMQQLFMDICPENLARLPFAPVLTEAKRLPAKHYLPLLEKAELLVVPDISGFVGADTVAGVLATRLNKEETLTLLVDIGTNGEMVLGNKDRMVACSTAAGPALEGAGIRFGMRGQEGAIDHVWLEDGQFCCSVIEGGKAVGICGSGLIDAVAAALDAGLLNARGRICNEAHRIPLTDEIYLTQEDIRQVQAAKGAIAAGIELMAAHLDVQLQDIGQVYLAGAFGTFLNPEAACRMGLLPAALLGKIKAAGNTAGSGAKLLACCSGELEQTGQLIAHIEHLELAALPEFRRCFARNMRF